MQPAIAPRALFGKKRSSQIPGGIFVSRQTNIGNAYKKQSLNGKKCLFILKNYHVVDVPNCEWARLRQHGRSSFCHSGG